MKTREYIEQNFDTNQVFDALEGYSRIHQLYTAAVKEVTTKIEILDDEFHILFDHNPIHHIESRLKSPASIIGKLHKKGLEISMKSATENLFDIAGIRIICHYLDDVYQMAEMLLKQNDITLIKKKDYIQNPKPNGYRSLHLTISIPVFLSDGPQNIPVEVQIRTIGMDFWASLDHELRYKAHDPTDDVAARLKGCAEKIAELDDEMQAIRSIAI